MNDTELNALLREGKLKMMILHNQTWTEVLSCARTVKGLRKAYWEFVKRNEAVGYQFITIQEHHLGRPSKPYR